MYTNSSRIHALARVDLFGSTIYVRRCLPVSLPCCSLCRRDIFGHLNYELFLLRIREISDLNQHIHWTVIVFPQKTLIFGITHGLMVCSFCISQFLTISSYATCFLSAPCFLYRPGPRYQQQFGKRPRLCKYDKLVIDFKKCITVTMSESPFVGAVKKKTGYVSAISVKYVSIVLNSGLALALC